MSAVVPIEFCGLAVEIGTKISGATSNPVMDGGSTLVP